MSATFRSASPSDTEPLLAMMRDFYELEHIEFAEADARPALAQILSDESLGRVWLIESGPERAGYLVLTFGFSLEFKGRDAFVDELYLRAEFRGRGYGRRALEVAEVACRELGVRALHLEVERANATGHELYRRFGFKAHDRHLMTKWID